ncbi:hypothetical protein As57867_003627, partial [Aphanomyces stellatus]
VVLASGVLQPTGLPPYVQIYCQLDENRAALTTLPTTVLAGVRELLDEHDLATGTVTPAFIENVVSNLYTRLKPLSPTHTITPTTMPARATSLHMWGEKLHKLPESFEFPTVDTATAWALWLLGKDGVTNFPFKSIEPIDLAKKERRILSEWRLVMGKLKVHYEATTGKAASLLTTEDTVVPAFVHAAGALDVLHGTTPQNRERRFNQLKVVTIARLLREHDGAKTKRPYQKRKRAVMT